MDIIRIVPVALFMTVGLISFMMAVKNLTSAGFLPFHEEAAGKSWDEIDESERFLFTSLMRIIGVGFLMVAVLTLVWPIYDYLNPNRFFEILIPATAMLFCTGLFINNYVLFKRTRANTPWQGSLIAIFIIVIGVIVQLSS